MAQWINDWHFLEIEQNNVSIIWHLTFKVNIKRQCKPYTSRQSITVHSIKNKEMHTYTLNLKWLFNLKLLFFYYCGSKTDYLHKTNTCMGRIFKLHSERHQARIWTQKLNAATLPFQSQSVDNTTEKYCLPTASSSLYTYSNLILSVFICHIFNEIIWIIQRIPFRWEIKRKSRRGLAWCVLICFFPLNINTPSPHTFRCRITST